RRGRIHHRPGALRGRRHYGAHGSVVGPGHGDRLNDFSLSLWERVGVRAGYTSVPRLIFKGNVQTHAIAADLAVVDGHIEFVDLGNAQVAHRACGGFDGDAGGRGPRLAAGADDLRHPIDTVTHTSILPLNLARQASLLAPEGC